MAGFCLCLLVLDCEQGQRAKGVARSGFAPARAPSERRVGRPGSCCCPGVFAGALPSLDARLGSQGAVPEAKGLIARLHDMAVVGEPVQQRRRHLGIAKHRRPLREARVDGDHHSGALVQLGEPSETAKHRRPG